MTGEALRRALADEFTAGELRLIAPYLERRRVEAAATRRVDQADALERLGEHVTAAATEAERLEVYADEAYEPDPDEGRDLDDEG